MNGRYVVRVALCGLIAGGVWTLLSVVLLSVAGDDLLATLRDLRRPGRSSRTPFTLLINLGAGIWAVWLYTALVPRYGRGTKTAIIAACAWWVVQSLQSAKWATLVNIPPTGSTALLAPATLTAMIVAVIAGAWIYESERPRS